MSNDSGGLVLSNVLRWSLLFLVIAIPAFRGLAESPTLTIGTISIRTIDVYGDDENAGLLGLTANRLHLTTSPAVIRELLLFAEGDPFVPERLEETERNLRDLPFIRKASVIAGEPHDGKVDVEVVTQDSWSTEPGLSFGSQGGGSTMAVEMTERNLLGRGWDLQYRFEDNPERTSQSMRFRDPSFLGPYWRAEAQYASSSDGDEESFHLERPFVSTGSRWSLLVSGSKLKREERLYESGLELSSYGATHERFALGYGWTISGTATRAHRISAGFDVRRDFFTLASEAGHETLPSDRDYRYLWTQYDYAHNDYLELDYVNRGELPEDFNLGTEVSIRLGVSPPAFGATETTGLVVAALSEGFRLGDRSLLLTNFGFESRIGATDRNALASARLTHITRFATLRPQSTVLSARFDIGSELDRDNQLFADGENGLRGYRLHAFEGDRRLILNAEHRVFLGRELFHLVSPGLVAFVDAGTATREDRIEFDDLKLDAGVGLLLGLSRSGRNIVRVDIAHAFSRDPLGRSPWVISVTGHRSF